MPRLFTGIEIPAEIGERLAFLNGGLPGARWITKDNYHLTLRFVGDVDMHIANDIAESLDRVQRLGFAISIDGLSSFGTRKPHAIVARVQPSRPLMEMQAEQERMFQRLGLRPDQRKFTPHVTLARLRGASGRDIANYLATHGNFFSVPIPVSRFVLFSARNSVGGGPYVVEEAYPLRPATPALSEEHDGHALNG